MSSYRMTNTEIIKWVSLVFITVGQLRFKGENILSLSSDLYLQVLTIYSIS